MRRTQFILVLFAIAVGFTLYLSFSDHSAVQTAGSGINRDQVTVNVQVNDRELTGRERNLKEEYIEARDAYSKADEELKAIARRHPVFLCAGSVEERGEDYIYLWGTAFSHMANLSHPAQQTEPTNIKIYNAGGRLMYNKYMGHHYYSHQETGKNQLGNPVPVYVFKSSVKEVEEAKSKARGKHAAVDEAEERLVNSIKNRYEKKIAADPENPDLYIDYGNALFDLAQVIHDFSAEDEEGRDYTRLAISRYEKALELEPENARALITTARTYYHLRKRKQVVAYFERIARIDPALLLANLEDVPEYYKIFALFNEGCYAETRQILKPIMEDSISGNDYHYIWTLLESSAYFKKGVRAGDEGNYREAVQYHDLALEKLSQAGYYADDLDELVEEERLNEDKGLYHLYRGKALVNLGKNELAREEYKLALGLQPDNPEIYLEQARLNYLIGYTNYAAMDIKKALKIDPDLEKVISSDSTLGDFYNSLALGKEIDLEQISINTFDLHLILKRDGTIWQWIERHEDGMDSSEVELVQIDDGGEWKAIAAAPGGFAALKEDGSFWHFKGENNFQKKRLDYGSDWAAISGNGPSVVLLKNDGTLWGWDARELKQINADRDWTEISAGGSHVLALKEDATLWAWGDNTRGQLGVRRLGKYDYIEKPTRVGVDNDWVEISAGIIHSAALKKDGTLWSWGSNERYILAVDSDEIYVDRPMQVGSDSDWKSVSAGYNYTLALKESNTLWGWGRNEFGKLTLERDYNPDDYSFKPLQLSEEGALVAGQAGEWGTLVLTNSGSLYLWGFKTVFGDNDEFTLYYFDNIEIMNINQ